MKTYHITNAHTRKRTHALIQNHQQWHAHTVSHTAASHEIDQNTGFLFANALKRLKQHCKIVENTKRNRN